MPEKRLYRVEVTPEAYRIIKAEAFFRGKTLKSIASDMISHHCSKEALKLSNMKSEKIVELKSVTAEEPIYHTSIDTECHTTEEEKLVCEPKKKRRLKDK